MYKLIGVISCLLLLSVGICVADDEAYIPSDESLLGGFGGGPQVMVCYHPSLSKLNAHLKKKDLIRLMLCMVWVVQFDGHLIRIIR